MAAEADELRREIRELIEQRGRGDLTARAFEPKLTEKSVALGRAVARERLGGEETILADHHVVHAHLKLTQPVLREPEQLTVSFFATPSRLIRMRGTLRPGRPVTCDQADDTVVDELPYADIAGIVRRWQMRFGEAAAGSIIAALAFLLRDELAVTGPILALLGVAGVLHALLMPTRWIELLPRERAFEPPFAIHAPLRKSARALMAVVRAAVADHGRARATIEPGAGSGRA